ncbi:hypothetical protein L2E82_16119 [Cichorium intybus]|uniref:Uncharacterized protein n=1 Tax=Cichorium intybus TaxID=13427 RepID=A0ACB9F585_CICIN|nr:hypothetical protein L2E82_16119 [Cichorium intybus]
MTIWRKKRRRRDVKSKDEDGSRDDVEYHERKYKTKSTETRGFNRHRRLDIQPIQTPRRRRSVSPISGHSDC